MGGINHQAKLPDNTKKFLFDIPPFPINNDNIELGKDKQIVLFKIANQIDSFGEIDYFLD